MQILFFYLSPRKIKSTDKIIWLFLRRRKAFYMKQIWDEWINNLHTYKYLHTLYCIFIRFISMKISQSLLASKDGSKFWWLPWFPAQNNSCVNICNTVYIPNCSHSKMEGRSSNNSHNVTYKYSISVYANACS